MKDSNPFSTQQTPNQKEILSDDIAFLSMNDQTKLNNRPSFNAKPKDVRARYKPYLDTIDQL